MDIKLSNGDWLLDERGLPVTVENEEKIFSRCENALTIPLGSFVYDKDLGSELHTLSGYEKGASENQAFQMAQKAVEKIEGVRIIDCNIIHCAQTIMEIIAVIEYAGKKREVFISLDRRTHL